MTWLTILYVWTGVGILFGFIAHFQNWYVGYKVTLQEIIFGFIGGALMGPLLALVVIASWLQTDIVLFKGRGK